MGELKNRKPKTGFNRPSVTAGNRNSREWKIVKACELAEGDIIAEKGKVELITETCGVELYIQAGEGPNELFLDPDSNVWAFARKDN